MGDTIGDQNIGSKLCQLSPQLRSKKRKSKTKDPPATDKKVKKDTDTKNPLKGNTSDNKDLNDTVDNQITRIMEDFDYHHTMNTENYEKYSEKTCALLKLNSVTFIDNAKYMEMKRYQRWLKTSQRSMDMKYFEKVLLPDKTMNNDRKRSKFLSKRWEEINLEVCINCVKHARPVEEKYWKTDRAFENRFLISMVGSEDQSDIDTFDHR